MTESLAPIDWFERASVGYEAPAERTLLVEAIERTHTLAELVARPELLAPPIAVVPRFAYRGRITLFPAPKKSGKSTTMSAVIAAASAGRNVLGEAVECPPITLWICCDEPIADLVRRLNAEGAATDRIHIHDGPISSQLIADLALALGADLVVIDTISDVAAGEITNENDAMEVKRLLAPQRRLAREHDIAVVILHHTNRATGKSRGSGVFEDIADLILNLSRDDGDTTVRKISVEGRVGVEDFRIRWTPEGLELADRDLSTAQLVRAAVWSNPGASTRVIREKVPKRPEEVQTALSLLNSLGHIENRGTRAHFKWHVVELGNHPGNHPENHPGTASEPPGTTTAPVPVPGTGSPPLGGPARGTNQGTTRQAAA